MNDIKINITDIMNDKVLLDINVNKQIVKKVYYQVYIKLWENVNNLVYGNLFNPVKDYFYNSLN